MAGYPGPVAIHHRPVPMHPFVPARLPVHVSAGLPPVAVAPGPIPMARLPDICPGRRRRNDLNTQRRWLVDRAGRRWRINNGRRWGLIHRPWRRRWLRDHRAGRKPAGGDPGRDDAGERPESGRISGFHHSDCSNDHDRGANGAMWRSCVAREVPAMDMAPEIARGHIRNVTRSMRCLRAGPEMLAYARAEHRKAHNGPQ
jgi:hypothetical protein